MLLTDDKKLCFEMPVPLHITMFAKKLITSRFIISSLRAQQFQNFSVVASNLNSKLCFTHGIKLFNNQPIQWVTSAAYITLLSYGICNSFIELAGAGVRTFTMTSRVCNITSQQTSENFNIDYDDLLKAQKDDKVLIIDVREDPEIQETGKLPGSIHIPMGEVSNALINMSSQEFEKKYNKQQPAADTKIILSCRSGKRSAMVQSDLQKLGYTNAYNYIGGWLGWESKQQK